MDVKDDGKNVAIETIIFVLGCRTFYAFELNYGWHGDYNLFPNKNFHSTFSLEVSPSTFNAKIGSHLDSFEHFISILIIQFGCGLTYESPKINITQPNK